LIQYINDFKPNILHFSGHGTSGGELALEDEDGNVRAVNREGFVRFLQVFRSMIRVVVLNACYSKRQATALSTIIDCTIGVKSGIGDKTAIDFASGFYRALGFGHSIQDAFDQAKGLLQMAGVKAANMPALIPGHNIKPSEINLINAASRRPPTEAEDLAWDTYVTLTTFLNSLSWYEDAEEKLVVTERNGQNSGEIERREERRDILRRELEKHMVAVSKTLRRVTNELANSNVKTACENFVHWYDEVAAHKQRAGHGPESQGQVLLNEILVSIRKAQARG
jgi:hypothetical protein